MRGLATALSICALCWSASNAPVDRVVVVKSTHTLSLLSGGQVVRSYRVALGGNPIGPKTQAGDHKTPEGIYVVDAKKPSSRFHMALHISYPNASDRQRARKLGVNPGGDIEIDGLEAKYAWLGRLHRQSDWTDGCIAVTNEEIEEIYRLVRVGTPVEIRPEPISERER